MTQTNLIVTPIDLYGNFQVGEALEVQARHFNPKETFVDFDTVETGGWDVILGLVENHNAALVTTTDGDGNTQTRLYTCPEIARNLALMTEGR